MRGAIPGRWSRKGGRNTWPRQIREIVEQLYIVIQPLEAFPPQDLAIITSAYSPGDARDLRDAVGKPPRTEGVERNRVTRCGAEMSDAATPQT